jgi:DNA helicase II / ATP-dependent DNA helicase PcrA
VFESFTSPIAGLSLLETLNEEQVAAVTNQGGPLLVLAGAGTGKTTTLSARVGWLVEQGVAPERVLLLTFTRRAAREMLGRVRSIVCGRAAGIVGGTFHSVAYRLVRAHASALGLPPNLAVLDASDAADLLDLLREELGLAGQPKRFPRKGTVADIYSATVNARGERWSEPQEMTCGGLAQMSLRIRTPESPLVDAARSVSSPVVYTS